jgi:hypothetical protein
MATPQTGQCRIAVFDFIGEKSAISPARHLIQINAARQASAARPLCDPDQGAAAGTAFNENMWLDISTAPRDREIELAVIDAEGQHALVFPCRRIADGWLSAVSGGRVDVRPTHWREWSRKD